MRRLFWLVAAVVLVDTCFYAAISPLLPHYADELDLSKSAAGILTASYAAGTLLAALPSGWLAARVGVKPTLLTGLALLAVSSVTFGFAQNVVLLDAARFAQGVGGACSWAGGLAWLIALSPRERRGQLIGSALAAAIAGVLLGPVLGGAATVAGPEVVFSGVAAVAVVLAVWAVGIPGAPPSPVQPWSSLARSFRHPAVLAAFWLVVLPAVFSGVLNVLAPLRLDVLGASGLAIGAIWFLAASIEAALSPLVGRLSDRRGRLLPLRWGLAGGAATALLLPLPGRAALLAISIVVAIMAIGTFWAPAMAMLSDAAETTGLDQGFSFALTNLAWAGGQLLGGAVGARVAQTAGDAVPYAGVAAMCAATLVALRAWRGRWADAPAA
jgi:MFS family permease